MTVYKNFLRVTWNYKIPCMLYLGIFLGVSFLSLHSQQNHAASFAETPLILSIADNDRTPLSRNLIRYLQSKHQVTVYNEEGKNTDAILQDMKKHISLGKIHAGIIILQNLEQNVADHRSGVMSFKDDTKFSSFYVDFHIQKFLTFAAAVKEKDGDVSFDDIHRALAYNTNVIPLEKGSGLPVSLWFKYFFNFLGWILFSVVLNSVGRALFELNNQRIKIRNTIAPISVFRMVCENFAAQLTVVLLLLAILIGFAAMLNTASLKEIPLYAYSFHAAVYTAVVLAITFMLNSFLQKRSVMGIVSTILPMSLAFISGIFLEQAFLPELVIRIARCFPTYYFVQANEYTAAFAAIDWKNTGILCVFLFLYFTIGVYFTKKGRMQEEITYSYTAADLS